MKIRNLDDVLVVIEPTAAEDVSEQVAEDIGEAAEISEIRCSAVGAGGSA